ncbi:uncharacterized protein [Drosophila takahashii]|uniref:uncharacterized protein isoform X1 n=1 Tax=Drosophila takahashii TaxID=29030 RepID=UPI001CF8E6ED|nr:uncharacterized protein LOC108056049 [Drosophila takahashii]
MPRFRNEEPEQSHYSDGDVVWVKIHNTEIWWPGEVTLSQDFRFVNSSRPPFAVVAFFNEKTFEQVKSPKLIYPFQCDHKEEFIKRGTKKADGMHMGDKFSDDVAIAESRYRRHQVLGLHADRSSVIGDGGTGSGSGSGNGGAGGSAPRPDSLIKAFLSSSSSISGGSSMGHNNSGRSSSGVPSPAGIRQQQAPTFRIMDIGGGGGSSASDPPRDRTFDEASYECNMCTFRTNSMSVLLIHRRAHLESSSSFSSSNSNSTSTTASTSHQSSMLLNVGTRKTRAARARAHTTTSSQQPFHRSSVRCHSRHVSIVVDAPLTNEEQKMVKSIAKQTLASIEMVVRPGEDSSSAASNRNSSSSSSVTPPANPRDPRGQQRSSNQLRATMPAPQSPPAKQRRLTRSMSRRQRGGGEAISPPAATPELLLPPPPAMQTPRRGANRRCTLAATEQLPSITRRGNPLRKTLTTAPVESKEKLEKLEKEKPPRSAGRRKRTFSRSRTAMTERDRPLIIHSSPPPTKREMETAKEKAKVVEMEMEAEPELPSTASLEADLQEKQQKEKENLPQSSIDASKQLQLSLMAEWGDDETDESLEEPPVNKETVLEAPPPAEQKAEENEELEEEELEEQLEKTDDLEGMKKKRSIRNIPKKDRRDVVVQEFQPELPEDEPQMDVEEEQEEPIVIPDSDASSNGSVVFVEDEPRQRGGRAGIHAHPNGNGNDKAATSSSSVKAVVPSCFDFEEEEEELLLQPEQPDGHGNGLSYRRRTNTNRCLIDVNGKSHAEEEEEERPAEVETAGGAAQELDGGLFKGFEDLQEPIAAVETEKVPEPEPKSPEKQEELPVEPEEAAPSEEPATEGDHLSLPIKERQKRIFKSRNKSIAVATQEEEEEEEVTPPLQEEQEEQEEKQEQQEEVDTSLLFNGAKSRSSSGDAMESLGSRSRNKRRNKSKTESNRRPAKLTNLQNLQKELLHEELSNNSSSSSGSSSNQASSSSSSSDSHCRLSPEPSSSNSCSIASNIAVISAEEARELQRSASGAGLIHAAIVDATQPVQRGGVLILEDIRLPNLYEPFGSLQSSSTDSNGSRQTNSQQPEDNDEQSQDTTTEEQLEKNEEQEQVVEEIEEVEEVEEAEEDEEEEQMPDDEPAEQPEQHLNQDQEEEQKEPPDNWSPERQSPAEEEVRLLPQAREVLLKKREQELLRQYEADLVSGRSAEKCRQARARWSRTMPRSPEEEEEEAAAAEELELMEVEEEEGPVKEDEELPEEEELQLQPMEEEEPLEDTETSLDEQLAAVELVLPATLFSSSSSRRPASHPPVTPVQSLPPSTQPARHLSCARTLSDADVAKAHQQLVDLREQQRLRSTSTSPTAAAVLTPPETLLQQTSGQRRTRRRSRNAGSSSGGDHVMTMESGTRSDVAEESSCETKDGQESPENPPQLCAGRICAVMTRPIPGYSHTFMLCSLNNNNFTPLNNVALYLDNEKNHLVPVPREALLEPPRLADGHPLSAVFADIDFLGGEAVAQVVEPSEAEDLGQSQDLSPRHLSPQMLLSEAAAAAGGEQDVDAMGIMTPLSQVGGNITGAAGGSSSYVNEEEELSLHEEQLQANVLQLNVNGHRLDLDPSMLFSIAEQPDSCIEVSVTETTGGSGGSGGSQLTGGMRAVLQARDILQAAEVYLQERDLQLVTLGDEDEATDGGLPVTAGTDLLSQALASADDDDEDDDTAVDFVNAANAGVGLLHIDTRTGGASLLHVGGSEVFISHPMAHPQNVHLTPPITARTNETNALLDQTPIMSTLENPSSSMQLRRVSPLVEGNLEDSLAVIGVTNGSGVPTSLELPITVTNPAIASRMAAPVADMLQFAPFQ